MYKLMIVDDELTALSSITRLIRTHFNDTFILSTYNDAQDALNNFIQSPADIVLTDIYMPHMDGLEMIQQMQEISQTFVPVVFSGFRDFSYAKKAISFGVIYYLEKPICLEELRDSLTAAIHRLSENKIRQNEILISRQEKSREHFFSHLSEKKISLTQLISSLNELSLPFSPEHSKGYFLRFYDSDSPGSPADEYDIPSRDWCHLVYDSLHPVYTCIVNRTGSYQDLIVIDDHFHVESLTKLHEQARTLSYPDIRIEMISQFGSLTELCSAQSVSEISSGISEDSDCYTPHESIREAISYINQHYAEDLSCESVASAVFMSRSHFSRLFKLELGISFLDYLIEVRIKKSIELLNTNIRIKDVYKSVGFNSQNRFNIAFKNYTDYTPSEYRRNVLKLYI